MPAEENLTNSFAFQLSKLGQYATDRFAERIAPLGLRPRHCGVLGVLQAGQPAQLDIASALGVSNSVVVNMLDELEDLGAVRRVRETEDRRRQRVELTAHGRTLARKATRLAYELDKDLLASLDDAQATMLREGFRALAKEHGLPGG
jgi:DNA-binding MarR family transcriptional regulator